MRQRFKIRHQVHPRPGAGRLTNYFVCASSMLGREMDRPAVVRLRCTGSPTVCGQQREPHGGISDVPLLLRIRELTQSGSLELTQEFLAQNVGRTPYQCHLGRSYAAKSRPHPAAATDFDCGTSSGVRRSRLSSAMTCSGIGG